MIILWSSNSLLKIVGISCVVSAYGMNGIECLPAEIQCEIFAQRILQTKTIKEFAAFFKCLRLISKKYFLMANQLSNKKEVYRHAYLILSRITHTINLFLSNAIGSDLNLKCPLFFNNEDTATFIKALIWRNNSLVRFYLQEKEVFLLTEAVKLNFFYTVNFLLKHGADPNCLSAHYSMTPIMRAIMLGSKSIIKLLLKYGANVNALTNRRMTPLMIAINTRNVSIIKLLLKNGAEIGIRNLDGFLAEDLAIRKKLFNVFILLKFHELKERFGST